MYDLPLEITSIHIYMILYSNPTSLASGWGEIRHINDSRMWNYVHLHSSLQRNLIYLVLNYIAFGSKWDKRQARNVHKDLAFSLQMAENSNQN